jgi:[acyl-carrier-protein] S-malonyltransferase
VGIAVLFPGQGAQAPGLGRPWADHEAWSLVSRAEAAAGVPLAPLLLDGEADDLKRTREAQLVVFLSSLLAWEAAKDDLEEAGIQFFGGHSLGQVTALVAAGAVDFEAGVRLAVRRATVTQEAADRTPGSLAALLGATVEQAEEACSAAPDGAWVANDNGAGQVVIGGTAAGLEAASSKAKEIGIKRVIPLNVGAAFHTPLLREAAQALAPDLGTAPFRDTTVPVISNVDGQPYSDGEGWRERLVTQLVVPVRWGTTMQTLVDAGVDTFVEVGPGSTLTGLAKRGAPGVALRNIATPSDLPTPVETS